MGFKKLLMYQCNSVFSEKKWVKSSIREIKRMSVPMNMHGLWVEKIQKNFKLPEEWVSGP